MGDVGVQLTASVFLSARCPFVPWTKLGELYGPELGHLEVSIAVFQPDRVAQDRARCETLALPAGRYHWTVTLSPFSQTNIRIITDALVEPHERPHFKTYGWRVISMDMLPSSARSPSTGPSPSRGAPRHLTARGLIQRAAAMPSLEAPDKTLLQSFAQHASAQQRRGGAFDGSGAEWVGVLDPPADVPLVSPPFLTAKPDFLISARWRNPFFVVAQASASSHVVHEHMRSAQDVFLYWVLYHLHFRLSFPNDPGARKGVGPLGLPNFELLNDFMHWGGGDGELVRGLPVVEKGE